jgi:cAMP phosphodiesterase
MLTLRLLPSTFQDGGSAASNRQHFTSYIVNGCVAFDAGSLANGINDTERAEVRDVVLSHAHLDHIAGLPLFVDDLFPLLQEPVRIHAIKDVIRALEDHVFNWEIYPRFSEVRNHFGPVIQYCEIPSAGVFEVRGLKVSTLPVNHKVPSAGFLVEYDSSSVVLTGDTARMSEFWQLVNGYGRVDAILIECAFPNEFEDLASISHHLTPAGLESELLKLTADVENIYVTNIKPAYRDVVVEQLGNIDDERLEILEVGREYKFG